MLTQMINTLFEHFLALIFLFLTLFFVPFFLIVSVFTKYKVYNKDYFLGEGRKVFFKRLSDSQSRVPPRQLEMKDALIRPGTSR